MKTNCERVLLRKMDMDGYIFCVVVKMAFKTFLCHFVPRHETWANYLTYMEQDGARGDHLILCAAANCFETCIHVVSCLHNDVIIRPHSFVGESKPGTYS